nr:MAG: ORF1 [TTV-like mini virus]
MPYWRRPYRRYTRYRRRYSTRRFRRPFRTTFYRRRHRRVRRKTFKRKLKSIAIRQWQPPTIKKLTITGLYPLFFCTSDRVNNNNTLYLENTTPFHIPSGGGFSLTQFTLQNLFDQHLRLRNWWTKSNDVLPLIRYYGCTMYLYYQENVDYIFAYDNNFPMKASRLTYNGTQPSVMQLMKNRKVIACKRYNKRKRPYKKVHIRPPSQLKNQWYFQHSLADIPLVNIICTAASLDRWYANSKAITTTIRFYCIDPRIFLNHEFKQQNTYGYQLKADNKPLFAAPQQHIYSDTIKIGDLIYLGNSQQFGLGTKIRTVMTTASLTTWNKYFSDKQYWGNPFMQPYLTKETITILCNKTIPELATTLGTHNYNVDTTLGTIGGFSEMKQNYLTECRYNPYQDKGVNNEVYFLNIDNKTSNKTSWEPEPNKPELIAKDLPLWTLYWGLTDWHKRANSITSLDTHSITVFKTTYIDPKNEVYYIPLGEHFLTERSPYFPFAEGDKKEQITTADWENWHPKLSFQLEVINSICLSGPGTVKLPPNISCEAHLKYKFHFKLGGSPPPMELIKNPSDQPIWTIPNNLTETTSLQSPGTPFEHFLYHFDQRQHFLTKSAIQRLKKDFKTKEIIPSITGSTGLNIPPQKTQESDSETSTEEETQTTLEQQLQQQRREQIKLRHRINKLLEKLSTLE